jgi:Ice-binding-like
MKSVFTRASRRSPRFSRLAAGCAPVIAITVVIATQSDASAAQAPVNLGTAASFAVLAGTTVTNTGPSTITGDLGVSPGTAVTGFPPGTVNGAQHDADAVALNAQSDLTTAYNDAAGRTPAASVPGDLAGESLTPGVYKSASSLGLTGTVTLNGEGDPNAVFIFQAGSTLITGSASHVALTGGAQACNVFWQVGSSATLGTDSTFVGNILALQSISVTTGATVDGRALARNGQVSLDDNTITSASCCTPTPTPTATSILSGVTPILSGAVSPILSVVTPARTGV